MNEHARVEGTNRQAVESGKETLGDALENNQEQPD
jgi:hypothetical protein